jgi:hypothetical protein
MQRTTLSPRDAVVVRQVGKLGQMSTGQLRAAVFYGVTQTPLDRSLSRLVRARYLLPVGRRASSAKGGAGSVVYQLGPKGWTMLEKPGRYWPYRSINEHSLRAADVYVALLAAEREGHLKMLSFEPEKPVGDARADVWLELGLVSRRVRVPYCLEIDLGTERRSRIVEKCAAYWRAYDNSTAETFPYIVFVAPDEWRRAEIARLIEKFDDERWALFRVCLFDDLVPELLNA